MSSRHLVWKLCLLFAGASLCLGQQRSAVDELRSRYDRQLMTDSRPLLEEHLRNLVTLEQEVAAKGDYEQALRIANRRDEVFRQYATTGAAEGAFLLRGVDARTTAKNGDFVGPFKTTGTECRWEVPRLPPGQYTVTIHMRSRMTVSERYDDRAPVFQFGEESRLGVPAPKVPFRPAASSQMRSIKIGSLTTQRIGATFLLELGNNANRETWIQWILLTPTLVTSAGPEGEAPAPPEALTTLREANNRYLRGLMEKPAGSYLERLEALGAGSSEDQKIANEKNRVLAGLENPNNWTYPSLSRTAVASSPGAASDAGGSVTKLRGATLVAGSAQCGATFTVLHEDKEYPVQLQLVSCPNEGTSSDFNQHFEITAEQSERLSSEATSFTSRYLTGKSFTLTTEWKKTPDGRFLGTIILPGLGSLQRVLVSRGLAMVEDLDEYSTQSEKFLHQLLLAGESEAREKKRGGWSLSN